MTTDTTTREGRPDARGIARLIDGNVPTDEQRAVVESDPTRPLLVVAGAGSGKTENLCLVVLCVV